MKALEKDRNRRYESANGLAADVRRHLDGEQVQAVPPSIGYQFRKFVRRHRTGAFVAGFVVASLAAIFVNELIAWAQIRRERDRAVAAEVRAAEERDEATRQKQRADESAAASRAVSDFLANDLLAQGR